MKKIVISDEAYEFIRRSAQDGIRQAEESYREHQAKGNPPLKAMDDALERMRGFVAELAEVEVKKKNVAHEIGRKAFELIDVVNRLIREISTDPKGDVMQIQEGLHEIEWKAERLAESLLNAGSDARRAEARIQQGG